MVIDLLGADEVEQSDQTHLQGVYVCEGGGCMGVEWVSFAPRGHSNRGQQVRGTEQSCYWKDKEEPDVHSHAALVCCVRLRGTMKKFCLSQTREDVSFSRSFVRASPGPARLFSCRLSK